MGTTIQDEQFEFLGDAGTVDDRHRLVLSKAVDRFVSRFGEDLKNIRFKIYQNRTGQILLSPETTVPLHEAWLHRNQEALASVHRGLAQAKQGKVRPRSFAKYADEEIE
jgi:hypothetical protein